MLEWQYLRRAAFAPVQGTEEGGRRLFLPSTHTFRKRRFQPDYVCVLVNLLQLDLRSILQTDGEEERQGQEQGTLVSSS